jgi:hypothetical protein
MTSWFLPRVATSKARIFQELLDRFLAEQPFAAEMTPEKSLYWPARENCTSINDTKLARAHGCPFSGLAWCRGGKFLVGLLSQQICYSVNSC